jgi:hypothetical protein
MSPVQQRKARDARSPVLAIGGLAFGVVLLLVVFVYAIPHLTESGSIRVNTGPASLDLGNARVKAELVADDGPFFFADPTGGSRDIFVQHIGADPLTGWTAFDARRPGTGRGCTLQWARGVFTDPCDGTTVPADGDDLRRYPVHVDKDEQLTVVLVTPATDPPATAKVTGSTRP